MWYPPSGCEWFVPLGTGPSALMDNPALLMTLLLCGDRSSIKYVFVECVAHHQSGSIEGRARSDLP